jgi:hypothetical protein
VLVDLHLPFVADELERITATVKAADINAVCLVGDGNLPTQEDADAVASCGVIVFRGVKVSLGRGGVLVFPADPNLEWPQFAAGAEDGVAVVKAAREAGFAVVACHPYDKSAGETLGDRVFQLGSADGVIVVSAGSSQTANDLAMDTLGALKATAAGGTGSNAAAGRASTLFATPFDSQERLVAELRSGDFWAVSVGADDRFSPEERSDNRGDSRRGGRGGRGREDRDGNRRGGNYRGGRSDSRDRGPDNRGNRAPRRGPRNQ